MSRVPTTAMQGRVGDHAEAPAPDAFQFSGRPFQQPAVQLVREVPVRPQGLPEKGVLLVEDGGRRPEMPQQGMSGGGHVAQRLVEGAEGGSFVSA